MSIYKIMEPSGRRTIDGHMLYYAQCTVCGDIIENRLSEFKRRIHNKCTHRYAHTDIKICKMPDKKAAHIFFGIVDRCYNPLSTSYPSYGGRGIDICEEWRNNPILFSDWYTDAISRISNMRIPSVDRIDASKGYSPENCRIISMSENARWKSTTMPITVFGITKTGRQWSEYIGLSTNRVNTIRRDRGEEYVKDLISKYILSSKIA